MQEGDNNVTEENLKILIQTATRILGELNDQVKKITDTKLKKNEKHLKSISALDRKISKYLKAIRQEQEKISKFKRISEKLGMSIDISDHKKIDIQKEELNVINENTGETVSLSQEEIDHLRRLSGE